MVDDGNGGTDTGTVTVTVESVNDAPDDYLVFEGSEDTPYVVTGVDLLRGFSDIDGDGMSPTSSLRAVMDNGDGFT